MEEESESNEEELIDEVLHVVSHKYAMEMFDKVYTGYNTHQKLHLTISVL